MATSEPRVPSRLATARDLLSTLAVAVASFVVLVAVFQPVVADYFPQGDEFALIVESTPWAQPLDWPSWFTSGYASYFLPYPEWGVPFTDFLRPVANLLFLINYTLWGGQWSAYLYLNYAILAAGAALAFWIARHGFNCAAPLAALAALGVLFNPAIGSATHYPTFILDALAAVFAGLAFLLVLRNRPWPALLLVCIGLFTKETVVFAPVAAALTLLLVRHRLRGRGTARDHAAALALGLAPLAVWFGARGAAFGGWNGTYAGREFFTHGYGLLRWPLGLDGPLDVVLFAKPFEAGRWEDISWWAAAAVALNVTALVLGAGLTIRALRRRPWSEETWQLAFVMPWIIGCFLVLTSQNLGARFGYALFLFGIPAFLGAVGATRAGTLQRRMAWGVTLVIVVLLAVPAVRLATDTWSPQQRAAHAADARRARAFIDFVRAASERYEVVYLLNDWIGAYAGHYVGAFSKSRGAVAPLSGIDSAPRHDSSIDVTFEPRAGDSLAIAVDLSPELHTEMWGAPLLRSRLRQGQTVSSADGRVRYALAGTPGGVDDHGLRIVLSTPRSYAIVYYDTRSRRFALYDGSRADPPSRK